MPAYVTHVIDPGASGTRADVVTSGFASMTIGDEEEEDESLMHDSLSSTTTAAAHGKMTTTALCCLSSGVQSLVCRNQ
jgi:hypothetical protein